MRKNKCLSTTRIVILCYGRFLGGERSLQRQQQLLLLCSLNLPNTSTQSCRFPMKYFCGKMLFHQTQTLSRKKTANPKCCFRVTVVRSPNLQFRQPGCPVWKQMLQVGWAPHLALYPHLHSPQMAVFFRMTFLCSPDSLNYSEVWQWWLDTTQAIKELLFPRAATQ